MFDICIVYIAHVLIFSVDLKQLPIVFIFCITSYDVCFDSILYCFEFHTNLRVFTYESS